MPLLIAQQPEPKGDVSDIHSLLMVIVAAAAVTGIIGYIIVRKFRNDQADEKEEAPFTLSQLRRIFEAGEISLEEFEHMRETMIAKVKASLGDDEIEVEEQAPATKQAVSKSEPVDQEASADQTDDASDEPAEDDTADEPIDDESRDKPSGDDSDDHESGRDVP